MFDVGAVGNAFLSLLGLQYFASSASPGRITCLSTPWPTIRALVDCFHAYTVPENTYDWLTYVIAQPTSAEQFAWVQAVTRLLNVDGDCTSLSVPDPIKAYYTIRPFQETIAGGRSYCVLAETTTIGTVRPYYTRGWGLVVVPATKAAVSKNLHFSTPHPVSEFYVPQQAAALFRGTGAKSLLIAGRHREAYSAPSSCISTYMKTDAAHDNTQPFFHAAVAIRMWQNLNGGCPSATCAYIQIHGKKERSCSSDDIFLSTGLEYSSWYTNPSHPVRRLQGTLKTVFPSHWKITVPLRTESACNLTATENIFGRMLNGVPFRRVCSSSASTVTGQFIHAEQDEEARWPTNEVRWIAAINNAF
ncbi:hypothetical protein AX16_008218 [Volvariella volvacea WC 439]|nr:hypothetical protein AX16_008218 [Volvariella volvacea WC 439]